MLGPAAGKVLDAIPHVALEPGARIVKYYVPRHVLHAGSIVRADAKPSGSSSSSKTRRRPPARASIRPAARSAPRCSLYSHPVPSARRRPRAVTSEAGHAGIAPPHAPSDAGSPDKRMHGAADALQHRAGRAAERVRQHHRCERERARGDQAQDHLCHAGRPRNEREDAGGARCGQVGGEVRLDPGAGRAERRERESEDGRRGGPTDAGTGGGTYRDARRWRTRAFLYQGTPGRSTSISAFRAHRPSQRPYGADHGTFARQGHQGHARGAARKLKLNLKLKLKLSYKHKRRRGAQR